MAPLRRRSYIEGGAGNRLKGLFLFRIAAAVAALAVAFAVVSLVETNWGRVFLLVLPAALLMAAGVYYRPERRIPFLADPMVLTCAFFSQFYVIGPLSLPLFNWHLIVPLPIETVTRTMLLFLLLLGCFLVAYQSGLGPMIAEWLPDFRGGRLKLPGRLAESVIILLSAFGCFLYIYEAGGLAVVLGTGYGLLKSRGLYQLPFHTLILGTIMMAWRLADSPRVNKLDWGIFVGLLLIELPFYGIILGARSRLFFLFFGIYTVWTMRRGVTRRLKLATVPLLAALLVFFAVWGSVRAKPVEQIVQGTHNPTFSEQSPYMGYLFSVAEPFAVACMLTDLFPAVEPHRYGRTLLVTFVGFIPRSVWPDKPIVFAKEVTRFTDGVFYRQNYGHSLTVTFVGDFWVNGGWAGVVIGSLAFGVLLRMLAAYSARGMDSSGGVQTSPARTLVAALTAVSLAEVRSESAVFLAFWGITSPWLFLSLFFCRLDYSTALADRRRTGIPAAEPAPAPLAVP